LGSGTLVGAGRATPDSKVPWDIMDGWKDYGNIEKEVLPESFRDRNLTACVSRFTLANH
jgi:hypothetical protein